MIKLSRNGIAYDLTKDPAIKDVIDDLEAKVERKLNE